jgi:hypothetical protein
MGGYEPHVFLTGRVMFGINNLVYILLHVFLEFSC